MESQVQNETPEVQAPKVEMTAPPVTQTKMVAPQGKGQKTYKIVALRTFQVGKIELADGKVIRDTSVIVNAGDVVEVSKAQAKDLCKKLTGGYAFAGERYNTGNDITHHDLTRARLATPADLAEQKPITPLEDDEIFED